MGEVLRKIPTHKLFKIGDLLIYYNKWEGWEKSEHPDFKNQQWFDDSLSWQDCQSLQVGDELWISDEPYAHSRGKVYGYKLIKIEAIEKRADAIRIGHSSGFFTIEQNRMKTLRTLSDEETIYNWTKDHRWTREC